MASDFGKLAWGKVLSATLLGGLLVAGCGDDDPSPRTSDSGLPDGGSDSSLPDGSSSDASPDAGDDGSVPGPATLSEVFSGVVAGVDDMRGLAYAADGKIYASGFSTVEGDRQVTVARFESNGTLDTTFGEGGLARHNVIAIADDAAAEGKGSEESFGVRELSGGGVLVVANANDGQGGQNVVLLKFDDEGTFDATFGAVTIDLGWSDDDAGEWPGATPPRDLAWDLILDTSVTPERAVIFAVGPAPVGALDVNDQQRTDNDRYIVRVRVSDGALDTDFGDAGRHVFDSDGANLNDNLRRGLVESDGSIVSAGYTNFGENLNNHVVLERLLPTGAPDTAFGFGTTSEGATKFNPFLAAANDGMAEAYAVGKQSTGRYVTTGYGKSYFDGTTTQENDLVTFGVLADGLDEAYGTEGSFAVLSELDPNAGTGTRPYRENGRDIIVLADDRTLHVGCYDDRAAFFLLTEDGAIDESFGEQGMIVYADHGLPFHKAAVSADGSRIAAITQGGAPGVLLAILEVTEGQ